MTGTTHDTPLRLGIVGLGYIGTTVGREFYGHPGATVAAVADVDDETRREGGDLFSVPPDARYADHEGMLANETLDAVLVGTPHTVHYEQVVAALERDLHVLCDKPLTTDLGRATDLAERAEGSEQVLMVGYQRHLNPAFVAARERWHGSDREPTHITAEITQDWISRFRDTWRTDPELSGGGNLYDSGNHVLDAVLWTTGLTPRAVTADMTFDDDERRVDTRANVLVEFDNDATATVSVFSDAPCVREHIHIWDDDGAVYLDGRQWEPRRVTEIDDESTDHVPYIGRGDQRTKADAFVTAIEEEPAPPATARDARRVTAVTEAAYEAARSGGWVDVSLE